MASYPNPRPQVRKRRYVEVDLLQDDLPSLPSKKLKSTKEHQSARNFPPKFYDSLSKVRLTRRALREFDRRNQLKSSVRARAAIPKPVRQRSTRKDLQRFARRGGPELGDLRGTPESTGVNLVHIMNSKRSSDSGRFSPTRKSKSTKSTSNFTSKTSNTEGSKRRSSAYNEDFEQYLSDNGIYMNNRKSKPSNVDEIRQRLAQPRPSLSPSRFSEGAFEEFQQKNEDVIKEGDVMKDVLPTLYSTTTIPHQEDLLFLRLKSITDEDTVDAKPDFYDGVWSESINKQVRSELGPYIIPTRHRTAPVAPNFFIEVKAPKGGADVAKRQVTHDLSLGARGMHKLQSYGMGEPVYDKNAYTLGASYHAGSLNIYATHVTPSGSGGSPEYHMTQIGGWNTIGDRDTYLRGAAALRNGRDQAMEWRNQHISTANERARSLKSSTLGSSDNSGGPYSTDPNAADESQTSVDNFLATSFTTSFATKTFAYPVQEPDLSNITENEENEFSADELALEMPSKPTQSHKRPSKGTEKTSSKVSRHKNGSSREKHPSIR